MENPGSKKKKKGKSKDFVLPSASVGVAETDTKNTTTHH